MTTTPWWWLNEDNSSMLKILFTLLILNHKNILNFSVLILIVSFKVLVLNNYHLMYSVWYVHEMYTMSPKLTYTINYKKILGWHKNAKNAHFFFLIKNSTFSSFCRVYYNLFLFIFYLIIIFYYIYLSHFALNLFFLLRKYLKSFFITLKYFAYALLFMIRERKLKFIYHFLCVKFKPFAPVNSKRSDKNSE